MSTPSTDTTVEALSQGENGYQRPGGRPNTSRDGASSTGETEANTERTHVEGVCRFATPQDRPDVARLVQAYLTERYVAGSTLLDDEHNVRMLRELSDAYTAGRLAGVTVLWAPTEGLLPAAIVMAGEGWGDSPWHTNLGRVAVLWGVYVDPQYRGTRVGHQMEAFGREHLRGQGFERVSTTVEHDNTGGLANWVAWDVTFGVRKLETRIIAELRERT